MYYRGSCSGIGDGLPLFSNRGGLCADAWRGMGEHRGKIAPLGEEAVRECVEKGKLDFFDFLLNSPLYMVLAPCIKNINRENINSLFSTTLINKSGFVMVSNFQELQSVSIQYRCIMSCLLGGLNS